MEIKRTKIENLITEETLCELFGCNPDQLARLRNKEQLPFLKVTRTNRLYLERDVIDWLLERRKEIGVSDLDEEGM